MEDIILFVCFGVPLLGALLFLVKLFVSQISVMRFSPQERSDTTTLIAKMSLVLLMIGVTIGLIVFAIILCFLPSVKLPMLWRAFGVVGLIVYWFSFGAVIMGLGEVVGHANVSAAWIFRELFGMRSKSVGGTKKEVKKHKAANNAEALPDRVPGKTQGKT